MPAENTPAEVAEGVYYLGVGRGITASNVYFVRSRTSWTLIDAAWPGRGKLIRTAAESLFGNGTRPASMLLTHIHPDHSGSARELACIWDVPVYVHPGELPLVPGEYRPEYGNPLDRWLIVPLMGVLPKRTVGSMISKGSLTGIARPFDPAEPPPGLPDWKCVAVPGHTPGHVAFFRERDRVLIAGDAALTVNLNSLRDLALNRHMVSGPPRYTTWDWPRAKQSVAALARLEPRVLACGHGQPMADAGTPERLRVLAEEFSGSLAAGRGSRERAAGPHRSGAGGRAAGAVRLAGQIRTRVEHVADRRLFPLGAWLYRRSNGRIVHLWHRRALILTARGRRSGRPRSVLLQFFPDGRDMVVVAANSGLPTHPGWYLNLKADPRADVEVEGATVQVRAEELSAEDAAALWPRVLQIAPDYGRYLKRTDRVIPLLRLIPVGRVTGG